MVAGKVTYPVAYWRNLVGNEVNCLPGGDDAAGKYWAGKICSNTSLDVLIEDRWTILKL